MTEPEPVLITGASSVPVRVMAIVVVLPSFKVIVYVSVCTSPPANACAPGPAVNVQAPVSSTVTEPYTPTTVSATKAKLGLSTSLAVN